MLLLEVWTWLTPLLAGIGGLLVGGIVGFFVSRKVFNNYLEKHPPITRDMVEAMMSQMGRKPSVKQVNAVMATIAPNAKNSNKNKK